jgi:universal stress protein F
MYTSILVPIDAAHTEAGGKALALATEIAKTQDAKITVLNVIEYMPGPLILEIPPAFIAAGRSEAERAIREVVAAHDPANEIQIVVREGHAAREILNYARENNVDMIVIASHNPGPADYIFGSVAAHVVRHAHCSVLVVRNPDA